MWLPKNNRQAEKTERERARTVSALTALENEEKRKMLAEQRATVRTELQREKNAQYDTRIANDTKAASIHTKCAQYQCYYLLQLSYQGIYI